MNDWRTASDGTCTTLLRTIILGMEIVGIFAPIAELLLTDDDLPTRPQLARPLPRVMISTKTITMLLDYH